MNSIKNMLRRCLASILSITLLSTGIILPSGTEVKADGNNYEKRIVGYFLGEDRPADCISTVGLSLKENIEKIDYSSLTHLNVSFMGPADKTAAVPEWKISDMTDENVRRIIELCHANNVKCILSVGGGANSGYKFFESEERSESFYNQILKFLDVYGFDGIDMDIESTTDKEKYSAFLEKLSKDLKSRNKTLSMAVAPYIIEGLGTNVSYFDFFNIMTYDANGSGTSNVAPYDWTLSQLNSYAYQSIPKEKMVVGLPFYGYSTDGRPAWACDYDYAKVVQMCLAQGNTDFLTQDSISISGEYNKTHPNEDFKVEFNSRATIMKKAEYVKNSDYGGVMIWDVTKDCIRDEDKQYALLPTLASYFGYPSEYEGPSNLVASDLTEENVHLEWESPTSWKATQYKVYYDNNYLGIVDAPNTCCVISDLLEGYTYEFRVVAIDPDGVETRPESAMVTTDGTPALPSLPEYDANTHYASGDRVIYNGQIWVARWGGGNETPTGVSGNMWQLDSSISITPSKTPRLLECDEHGTPSSPIITPTSLSDGTVGKRYSKTLTAKGTKPIKWSIFENVLPTGLSLDSDTGVISGIPEETGTYAFTVKAENSIGITLMQYTITIKEKMLVNDDYDKDPGTSKRVIGYLPWWRNTDINNIDYEKLDYVIIAFLRYTADGWDFGKMADGTGGWTDAEIRTIVDNAHKAGTKVFISVGGGDGGFIQSSLPFWYENSREYLANCIMEAVDIYGFDGVDMDAETDDIKFWQGYSEFVDLIRTGIDARGLEMSMAVHTWFTDLIEDEAALYAKYDFINVMSYDCQYDRNGVKIGIGEVDHAPMWHTYQLLDHYTEIGVPADKINVGIPFYYYTKGGGWDGAVSYAYYLSNSSSDVTIDTNSGETKVEAWKRTTEQKAYLGGTEYGGAFIWEIGQDNLNNKNESLLNLVYDGVKNGKEPSTPMDDADKVYPELAPVTGTDLPLTPIDKTTTQPDFPALGATTGGTTGGSVGGDLSGKMGSFSWTTKYQVGDLIEYQGHIFQSLRSGVAWNSPTIGYDNETWKYIGTADSVSVNTGSDSEAGTIAENSDDGVRVLIAPYWWMNANEGDTLKIEVPSGKSVAWSVRSIEGASPEKSSIISVDENGVVIALAEGCAVVDAYIGSKRVASMNVRVLPNSSSNATGVEINGYQISSTAKGVRTIYSVEPVIDGKDVEEVGLVYSLQRYATEEQMYCGSDSNYVKTYKESAGKLSNKYSASSTAESYAMTMKFALANSIELTEVYMIRAYAKLSDGTYVYSGIHKYSAYQIAENLYNNQSMVNESAHNYLYDSILSVVNKDYKKVEYNPSNTLANVIN